MAKTIKTRTLHKLVGSDYSAQEPRITTFLSGDPNMRQAYLEGKDLYCVIAANIYNNKYEDNLEHYPEGTVLELDGNKVVAGSDKLQVKQATNKLEVPYYYLIPTAAGYVPASGLKNGDKVVAKEGTFEIMTVDTLNDITTIYFND